MKVKEIRGQLTGSQSRNLTLVSITSSSPSSLTSGVDPWPLLTFAVELWLGVTSDVDCWPPVALTLALAPESLLTPLLLGEDFLCSSASRRMVSLNYLLMLFSQVMYMMILGKYTNVWKKTQNMYGILHYFFHSCLQKVAIIAIYYIVFADKPKYLCRMN